MAVLQALGGDPAIDDAPGLGDAPALGEVPALRAAPGLGDAPALRAAPALGGAAPAIGDVPAPARQALLPVRNNTQTPGNFCVKGVMLFSCQYIFIVAV